MAGMPCSALSCLASIWLAAADIFMLHWYSKSFLIRVKMLHIAEASPVLQKDNHAVLYCT